MPGEDSYDKAERLRAAGLSWSEVADELGVSRRTLYNWRAAGKVRDDASQAGNPASNGGPGSPDGPSLSDSRARKEAALAEKHELDAARQRGELIELSHLRNTLAHVRRVVDSMPRRLCQDVAELLGVTPREALPLLERMAAAVREELLRQLEQWAESEGEEEPWKS